MSLKITFVNPNSGAEVDKYLPKILAEAVFNKIARQYTDLAMTGDNGYDSKQSG